MHMYIYLYTIYIDVCIYAYTYIFMYTACTSLMTHYVNEVKCPFLLHIYVCVHICI